MVFRTWDLNFGTWISHRGFTVAFGRRHPLVYIYIYICFDTFMLRDEAPTIPNTITKQNTHVTWSLFLEQP
jgi:hypothetical protein